MAQSEMSVGFLSFLDILRTRKPRREARAQSRDQHLQGTIRLLQRREEYLCLPLPL